MQYLFFLILFFSMSLSHARDSYDFYLRSKAGERVPFTKLFPENEEVKALIFFQTTCGPCLEEIPLLIKILPPDLYKKVVLISVKEKTEAVKAFDEKFKIPFELYTDSFGMTVEGLDVKAIPTILFIRKNKVIVERWLGNNETRLKNRFQKMLEP